LTGRSLGIVALVGLLGWVGLVWLGWRMVQTDPPTAAFDLELLLRAGRVVAAGRSPYDPALVGGAAPVAERLFYSYPPIVAQVLTLVAGVPSAAMFAAWTVGATAAFAAVAVRLAGVFGGRAPRVAVAAVAVAVTPLVFPFAIGLLFGNVDVFFPALYGLLLVGVLPGASVGQAVAGGVATAVAAIGKLHPASLGVWLLVRAVADRPVRRVVAAAIVAGIVMLGLSVALAPSMWADYLAVVRAGSGADLVDPRNAGPAAQIALLIGDGGSSAEGLARTLQIPVTIGAVVVTALAAWRTHDTMESLAWAAAASLVTLPVTWFHYPSALLPFAAAAVLRSAGEPRVRGLVLGAAVVAAVAIAFLPLLYVAVGLVLAAVRASRSSEPPVTAPAPG
jgi:hypothetical protein